MSVGTADLHKAIFTAWNASGLNAIFQALGGDTIILWDSEALPGQSYPYCILEEPTPSIKTRMSGSGSIGHHEKDIAQRFFIFASEVDDDVRSAKEIAAYLAEEVLKVFGGHPTVAPTAVLTLDHGNHVVTQYNADFGAKTSAKDYQWIIDYVFKVDVPVQG